MTNTNSITHRLNNDNTQHNNFDNMTPLAHPSVNQTIPLPQLPREIVQHIFYHLSARDQAIFSQVSTNHRNVYKEVTNRINVPSRLSTPNLRLFVTCHIPSLPNLQHITLNIACLRPTLAHAWRTSLPKLRTVTSIRLPSLEEPYALTQATILLRLLGKQLLHLDTTATPGLNRMLSRIIRVCDSLHRITIRACTPRRRSFAAGGACAAASTIVSNLQQNDDIAVRIVFPAGLDGLSAAVPLSRICQHRLEPVFPLCHSELVQSLENDVRRIEIGQLRKKDDKMFELLNNTTNLEELVIHSAESEVWSILRRVLNKRIWRVVIGNRNDVTPGWMWGFAGIWKQIDIDDVLDKFGESRCRFNECVVNERCYIKFSMLIKQQYEQDNNEHTYDVDNRITLGSLFAENGQGMTST